MREMLVTRDQYESRVAILEDSKLVELYIERSTKSVVGNVYLGRVTDVLPGMQAAFVDIGLEKNAFLYVDDVRDHSGNMQRSRSIAGMLSVGQVILVQVARDSMGTKGARVTMDISIPGRFVVLMPYSVHVNASKAIPNDKAEELIAFTQRHLEEASGAIVRTASLEATEQDMLADINFLNRLWRRVKRQVTDGNAPEVVYTEIDLPMRFVRDVFNSDYSKLIVEDRSTFDKINGFIKRSAPGLSKKVSQHKDKNITLFEHYDLDEQIKQATYRELDLPSGGRIVIDITEALVAIDVNTGSFVGRRNLEETILKTNMEAASTALQQIRLRDLGGIIIIDFIDMENAASKRRLQEHVESLLSLDRSRTQHSNISQLGLVQIARQRTNEGIYQMLTDTCPMCKGQGRSLSKDTVLISVERKIRAKINASKQTAFLFGVNPYTYETLLESGVNFAATIRAETGKTIHLSPEPDAEPTEVIMLIEGYASGKASGRRGFIY